MKTSVKKNRNAYLNPCRIFQMFYENFAEVYFVFSPSAKFWVKQLF